MRRQPHAYFELLGIMDRREFFKTALAASSIVATLKLHAQTGAKDPLRTLADNLLADWCNGLRNLQIKSGPKDRLGGIKCPACDIIHGRIGDAVYPFLCVAKRRKDSDMLDSGIMLYDWMENNVSQADGSWINDFSNPWKGTSVFGAISLGEGIKNCGGILESKDLKRMRERLRKAASFIDFFIKFGKSDVKFAGPNINYLAAAAHALAISGEVLDEPKFTERAKYFGKGSIKYITKKDFLIYGETQPTGLTSPNGCKGVDLGYNVEETIPSLVGYAQITGDQEALDIMEKTMKVHIEFMLPDGAWDNSWGTRNFKWTYWGSRTSDGCQAGFAALADRDSRFYTAALKNLELLSACTHGGLLYGGPHFRAHGQPPCIHHTFAHVKPLAALLDSEAKAPQSPAKLPRESAYGVKCFEDIRTYLAAKGPYRATVTGYDTEYYDLRNGHATGGALSMLWHEKAGPIFTAGMTEYAVIEKPNMQSDKGLDTMPLAPRAELECGGVKYRNVSDLSASLSHRESGGASVFEAVSVLRDADQKTPPSGEAKCRAVYEISADSAVLKYSSESELCKSAKIFFPLISESGEKFSLESPTSAELKKKNCTVRITSDKPIKVLPTKSGRIFNFVPGFEAVPLYVESCNAKIKIEVV